MDEKIHIFLFEWEENKKVKFFFFLWMRKKWKIKLLAVWHKVKIRWIYFPYALHPVKSGYQNEFAFFLSLSLCDIKHPPANQIGDEEFFHKFFSSNQTKEINEKLDSEWRNLRWMRKFFIYRWENPSLISLFQTFQKFFKS